MSAETFSLDIPQQLYEKIKRFAAVTHQPIDKLMLQTLGNIPVIPENLPESVTEQLVAMEELDDDMLWEIADLTYGAEQQKSYSALLHKQSAEILSEDEQQEIEQHLETVQIMTLKKAYAYALLKWRGHVLPSIPTQHPLN